MELLRKLLADSSPNIPRASIVVFGATGDLVTDHGVRKAFGDLVDEQNLHPEHHRLVFTSRRTVPAEKFLLDIKNGDTHDQPLSEATMLKLAELAALDSEDATLTVVDFSKDKPFENLPEFHEDEIVLFYAALPPSVFETLSNALLEAELLKGYPRRRLLLEKPFGQDFSEAKVLANIVQKHFPAEQVYLVDHFLAYPGMLEWLSLRTNPSLDEALCADWVCPEKGVHVILSETIMSNDRAYFRETGILEDMLQNHAMQVLANSCMDLAGADTAHAWRERRDSVVQALRWNHGDAPRAQVEGFNDPSQGAPKDAKPSEVETFASIGFTLDMPRWKGVPMRMTAAKGVEETRFGLDIHLKALPYALAAEMGLEAGQEACLEVDVHAGTFHLRVADAKHPLQPPQPQPDRPAYSRVFLDALEGEHAFFVGPDESVAAWSFVNQVQDYWKGLDGSMPTYKKGTSAHEVLSAGR